jgi:NAD(P)-dependent dehydrogenase (short-subunit alcohol dehydrogenase family)
MKLTRKRAVITGASHGLGRTIAKLFAKEGADVLICARDTEELQLAEKEIRAEARGVVVAETANIAAAADVGRLAAAANEKLGGLDVLVCNAGVYGPMG